MGGSGTGAQMHVSVFTTLTQVSIVDAEGLICKKRGELFQMKYNQLLINCTSPLLFSESTCLPQNVYHKIIIN